jgi:hypothetical protein
MPLDPSTTVLIEDAKIILKNFAGNEGPMNAPGDRNFCVVLPDPKLVEQMIADGWNVRPGREDDEGNTRDPFISVKLGYNGRIPPKVVMISSRGRTNLTEDMVEMLDWSRFKVADVIFRPYAWSHPSGKSGIKAYLVSLFVTIEEDELDLKYADVPMADEKKHDEQDHNEE